MNNELSDQYQQYKTISRVIYFIQASAPHKPSLEDIASEVNLAEGHLQRIFKAWAGLSLEQFLQFFSKEHALRALDQSRELLNITRNTRLSNVGQLQRLMINYEAMIPEKIKAYGKELTIGFGIAKTPFGDGLFGWTTDGLCYLAFCDNDHQEKERELAAQWLEATLVRDNGQAASMSSQIFTSTLKRKKLNLVLRGSDFQLKVWEALLKIPPSQLVSYSQLAGMAGSPKAQRAVGSALAANTIGFLIPCHRVIRGNGELGHYRWGKVRKQSMQIWDSGQFSA
ncbi:bifunctional helix-turn-helix domain-containing protein/methylated-DNA--[protein]-cysteine S-methyltransferase [Endozoicomonas sp. Mp262]|uniref:bifunctional helix-turn-helix domain-containing protein/methylated-DNA--[protein]-cysteine S-methyltransferase n=1 Tax=Endozoicomonas sp. Mp262 TaxID=2919499 RepID=UPI0021D877C0